MKWTAIVLALAASQAQAAVNAATQAEVGYLLEKVEQSGCRFNRNGSWYDSHQARAHLQKKYDYMAKRDLVKDTETFIDQGASRSSMSGKAYQIQCPGAAPVDAGSWLREALKRKR